MVPAMAKVENDFHAVWTDICVRFHAGQHITTKSLATGVPSSTFTVLRIEPERVVITCSHTMGECSIHRDAFEEGFLVWPKYCEGAIPEDTIRDTTLSFIFGFFRML